MRIKNALIWMASLLLLLGTSLSIILLTENGIQKKPTTTLAKRSPTIYAVERFLNNPGDEITSPQPVCIKIGMVCAY